VPTRPTVSRAYAGDQTTTGIFDPSCKPSIPSPGGFANLRNTSSFAVARSPESDSEIGRDSRNAQEFFFVATKDYSRPRKLRNNQKIILHFHTFIRYPLLSFLINERRMREIYGRD